MCIVQYILYSLEKGQSSIELKLGGGGGEEGRDSNEDDMN